MSKANLEAQIEEESDSRRKAFLFSLVFVPALFVLVAVWFTLGSKQGSEHATDFDRTPSSTASSAGTSSIDSETNSDLAFSDETSVALGFLPNLGSTSDVGSLTLPGITSTPGLPASINPITKLIPTTGVTSTTTKIIGPVATTVPTSPATTTRNSSSNPTTTSRPNSNTTTTRGSTAATTSRATTTTRVTTTTIPSNTVPIPRNGAYIGMNTGDAANGISLDSREALLGQGMALERIFYGNSKWTLDKINIDQVIATHNKGRVPAVSFKVGDWKSVTAGNSDAIIDKLALQIKSSQIPMLLTFHHEPDEEACLNSQPNCGKGQTSQDFVNMWRHIHNRFDALGVNNVSWNFIVMGWQWGPHGNTERRIIIEDMYPGSSYVDWISSDLYNVAGNCSLTQNQISSRWIDLKDEGQGWHDWASQFNKPLAIMELGTFHDSLNPGRKAQWYRDAIGPIKEWDIKAVAYFDRFHEGCDWRIDTGGNTELNGYRDFFNDPYFIKS